MRKISLILIVCLIFMCMQNVSLADEKIYTNTIRVGISYGSSASAEAWFYSESPIDIMDVDYYSYITTIPANTRFNISLLWGALTSDYFSPTTSSIRLDSTSSISYNNNPYYGSFELKCHNDKITVINVVNTEDYIASVLGKEMSSSWPIEALKAQAVCARNYAVTNLGRHSSYGFDLCTTQDCQVYGGINSEADKTRRAVDETRGVLVTYKGKVVPLYYFSCDGGYTENSENVWVSAEGYLRGKKDIHESPNYATYYNWSTTYTKGEIENILASKNMSVGELLDIRIDTLSENNGVIKLTFVGTEGEKSVTKTQTRTVLSLKSQSYTIEKHVAGEISREETETVTQHVLSADGIVAVTNPAYTLTSSGLSEIKYSTVTVQEEAESYDSYTFNGHGWGHLVGMSQWGAYSMAINGYNYKDILTFYYTDIAVVENSYTVEEESSEAGIIPEEATEENEEENTEYAEATEIEEITEIEEDTDNREMQWSDTGI